MAVSRTVAVFLSIILLITYCRLSNENAIDAVAKPGVAVRFTKAGFSYAGQTTVVAAIKKLGTTKIPDVSGEVFAGFLKYNITGIKLSDLATPVSYVTFPKTSGVTWQLRNITFNLAANFTATVLHFDKLLGGLALSTRNSSLEILFSFNTDGHGRPTATSSCRFNNAGNWDLKFSGSWASFFNLMTKEFKSTVIGGVEKRICSAISSAINKGAAKLLPHYPVLLDIGTLFEVDYSLLGAPVYNSNYLSFPLKGESFLKKKRASSTVVVPDLPPFTEKSRMVYFLLSDYLVNSLSFAAFHESLLDKNVTNKDLPPDQSYFLNTTCPGNLCLGKLIAQTASMFPNGQAEMRIKLSKRPEMKVSPASVAISFAADVKFYVNQPKKSPTYMFSIKTNLDTLLHILPNQITSARRVTAAINKTSLSLSIHDSAIGSISVNLLKTLVDTIVNLYVRPQLNKLGAVGIPLPGFSLGKTISYVKPKITLLKDAIIVGADMKYSKAPKRAVLEWQSNIIKPKMSFQAIIPSNRGQPINLI